MIMDYHPHLLPLSCVVLTIIIMACKVLNSWWISPNVVYRKLRANGISGPEPSFPLGNLKEMRTKRDSSSNLGIAGITHDIHSTAFPYFSNWQKSHGKVYNYWLGTEPFLYIADPEFLKKMSSGVMGKSWGKPTIFKNDRKPMFGNGLVMVEGDDWVRHRHLITPAFSQSNLKGMSSLMMEAATNMMDRWRALLVSNNSGNAEIDVEKEIINTAGEIIAKTSFGISYENGQKVLEKLRHMQSTLFKSNRYVGVPFSKYIMSPAQNLKAALLGKEIDELLLSIIDSRRMKNQSRHEQQQQDLLGMLLAKDDDNKNTWLSRRDLVDECKTFFFGGHETTALALTWTLLLLAMHPHWQSQLREEIKQVMGDDDQSEFDPAKLTRLKKLGWVMNEVLRLYPPAPNVQRQARGDIRVDNMVIPKGTNIWIDVVSMHHDKELWGEDVHQFRPERFEEDQLHGGCKHKMGFLPFGFGGRMCVGRNLSMMEYRIVVTKILTSFTLSLSPNYTHSPAIMLSLRPNQGLPLILTPL